jgi:cell division protein FtsI/penicillin-binding protein 2
MNKVIFFFAIFLTSSAYSNFNFYKDLSLRPVDKSHLGKKLSQELFKTDNWPENLEYENKNFKVNYSLNEKLGKFIKKQLRRYRSDYASVVVIDNNNGRIISAIDYTRDTKKFGKNITFSSTNPAASVFKVITAAELLENSDVKTSSLISYSGRATTLYKYQLKDKKTRWTRKIPFKSAFAYSNNVVFGKTAIKNTSYSGLTKMANKFGFNKSVVQLINVGNSKLFTTIDDYGLAELASGFNRDTMISPVHGAVIASIIANDGVYIRPTVVKNIVDEEFGREVWSPHFSAERVLTKESNTDMQKLMELTVKRGTARGAFRPWKMKRIKDIRVGGKTGTITGGLPYGKRDWFISYAVPEKGNDKGISVCVMIVNVEKWYIKSTVLAKKVIEHYYSKINKNR